MTKQGEKKRGTKRNRRPSRPPWCLPEDIGEKVKDKEEKEKEAGEKVVEEKEKEAGKKEVEGKEKREEKGNKSDEQRRDRGRDVLPVERAATPVADKVQSSGRSKAGAQKGFSVVQHLDLLTESSEDMDLDSDHERNTTRIEETTTPTTCNQSTQPQDITPVTPQAEPGVTMNEGGPGTQLHWELMEYDRMSQLTPVQAKRRADVVSIITEAALRVCPGSLVMPFGGFANGLCTPASDLDLVIVGVAVPNADHGGYKDREKILVSDLLGAILLNLRSGPLELKKQFVIRRARIPIIKLTTSDDIDVDISICDDHGPRAANFMRSQVQNFSALRPLVLALKNILKDKHLNEVVVGGMGTYTLSNMVLAHLMECRKDGALTDDFGCLLVSFLERFGKNFDYLNDAVSVRRHGMCSKSEIIKDGIVDEKNYVVNLNRRQNGGDPPWERLLVEDYFTGRDVSSGTYRIGEIQRLFGAVHRRLSGQFLIPPLPPDSPYLSTLSTLFKIKGVSGTKKASDVGLLKDLDDPQPQKRRRRFSETKGEQTPKNDAGMTPDGHRLVASVNSDKVPGDQDPLQGVQGLGRTEFVNRVKSILRGLR